MRCDVNISLRPVGSDTLGTRAEIKNVNSFRFVEKAIRHEIERQSDILEDGGKVVQETRLYDAERDETRPMRSKEVANDYRYFPEPDLLPVVIDDAYIEAIRAESARIACRPKAPALRGAVRAGQLRRQCAVRQPRAGGLFRGGGRRPAVMPRSPPTGCRWNCWASSTAMSARIETCPVSAADLGGLIRRILDNSISGKIAKQVFEAMWQGEGSADAIIEARGLQAGERQRRTGSDGR